MMVTDGWACGASRTAHATQRRRTHESYTSMVRSSWGRSRWSPARSPQSPQTRSPTSSSSGATTSASTTSAPTTTASWATSTPNIDRIAKEGALFTDAYAQQSCTAGRASFILGQHPFRTGLLTIGMPGIAARHPGLDADHRRPAQGAGLRHRPVRQEPPRRPGQAPADGARLRRVLRQPLPPERRGGAGDLLLPEGSGVQEEVRPARRAALHGPTARAGRRSRTPAR